MTYSNKRAYNIALAAAGVLAAVGLLFWLSTKAEGGANGGPATKAVVYLSPTCGCCGNYVSYLKRNGFDVEKKNVDASERSALGVPASLASCHTTMVEGYAVEGHVPVEAIRDLLAQRPPVKGIGMPGMPSGSPGMPGTKIGKFEISSFTENGTIALFEEL